MGGWGTTVGLGSVVYSGVYACFVTHELSILVLFLVMGIKTVLVSETLIPLSTAHLFSLSRSLCIF